MPAEIVTIASPTAVGGSVIALPTPVFGDFLLGLGGLRSPSHSNSINPNENLGLGWGQVGAQGYLGYRCDDNQGFTAPQAVLSSSLAGGTGSAVAAVGTIIVDGFDCDSFDVDWTGIDNPNIIDCLVVGEKSDVAIGQAVLNNGTGLQSFTGLGFQPDLLLIMHEDRAAGAFSGDRVGFMIGAADGTRQFCMSSTTGFTDPSNTIRLMRNDSVLCYTGGGSGGVHHWAKLDAFLADGFRLNRIVSAGRNVTFTYLAIRDPELAFEVGSFQQGDTSVAFNESHAVAPDALLFFGANCSAFNTLLDHDRVCVGFATADDQRLIVGGGQDNRPRSETSGGWFDNACVGSCTGLDTEEYRAAINGITTTGFGLTNVVDDGGSGHFCYVTLSGRPEDEGPCARAHERAWAWLV